MSLGTVEWFFFLIVFRNFIREIADEKRTAVRNSDFRGPGRFGSISVGHARKPRDRTRHDDDDDYIVILRVCARVSYTSNGLTDVVGGDKNTYASCHRDRHLLPCQPQTALRRDPVHWWGGGIPPG